MAEEETSIMKKHRNLIILGVVLVLLVGSYVFIKLKPKKKNTSADADTIKLMDIDAKKIKKLTIKTKDSSVEVERTADSWKLSTDPNIKIDSNTVESIASAFASLSANRMITDKQDELDSYGLKTPENEATATLDSGEKKTFYIGGKSPDDLYYYVMAKGDTKVYTISSSDGGYLTSTLSSIRDKAFASITQDDISYVSIKQKDGTTTELQKAVKDTALGNEFGEGSWVLTKPYSIPASVDTDKINTVLQAIPTIEVSEFVADNVTDFAKYGLDKPSYQLVIKYKTETLDILFGNDEDESHIYFRPSNSTSVYTMDKNILDSINVKPFDMMLKFACLKNIDDVDSIAIDGLGNKYTLSMTRTKKAASSSSSSSSSSADEYDTKYYLNGREVNEDDFKKTYQAVIGLTVDSENDRKLPMENPQVTVTFNMKSGSEKQVVVNYCNYNDDFYAVYRNGKSEFLIAKSRLQDMFTSIKELAAK